MKKKVILGDEAKKQILEGAELLYNAVSTTLSPKGQNGVIEVYGEPIVTHDGVTVAKAIEVDSKDRPGVRVGIEMIKASSSKTNDNVGDGTTSSTILAYHLISEGMARIENGKNPMILRRELDVASKKVLEELEKLSEPLKTEKATIEVATISSENEHIGREVGKMYHKLGKDAMVAVDVDQSRSTTKFEIVEGYTFDRGLISPLLVMDSRTQTTTVENPAVLVVHQTIAGKDVAQLVKDVYNTGKDCVVIIADDFKDDFVVGALELREMMTLVGIKVPGFGEARPELLKDIATLCGTKVFGTGFADKLNTAKPADLGTCEKVVASTNETVITGGQDVSEYIKDLESKLKTLKGEFDKQKLEKRIAMLRAKVGQIHVGGNTEMEAEERKYLIDDAVAATEAALKDGIVPGGGTTYVELSRRLKDTTDGADILREALLSPFKVLMTNSGERYGKKLEELGEFGKGFDVMTPDENGELPLVDMKEHGIIDPVLVIRQAITNAVSVAGSALTTGVLITLVKEKEDE
ncbi:groeL [Caudoviricetes sp.]|nr:groeL [Caudoviricetes sp.]